MQLLEHVNGGNGMVECWSISEREWPEGDRDLRYTCICMHF